MSSSLKHFFKMRIKNLSLPLTLIFSFLFCLSALPQSAKVTENLRNELISENVNDSAITSIVSKLSADGSWSDIDYSNTSITNWIPATHSGRLVKIGIAYNKPGSLLYHKPDVMKKIKLALDFYIKVKPVSKNWWYNAIGAPTNFGPALILLKTGDSFGLDQKSLDYYSDSLLNYYTESAKKWPGATTGANKIWLLSSSIHKACIKNNDDVLKENFSSAFEEAKVMSGKAEGIKIDNSFYQHGPQLYTSGYGMSFMMDITYFGIIASGTTYQMSDQQLSIITNTILDGYRWFSQITAFDFGTSGREISRPNAMSTNALKTVVSRLISMNAPRKDELSACLRWLKGKSDFSFPGNRHFWKSDIMVQHGKDFYLSARVPSKRIYATERMNNENLKRLWLPWGSTNIMREGDEYRGIFAVWDWSRIPGVTSVMEDVPSQPVTGSAYLVSKTDFAGGVSDGNCGLAAYDYSWEGVEARKAYFFTPEGMFCFGAGITASKSNPVITSVNQCFSSGEVIVRNNGKLLSIDSKELNSSGISAVWHNRIGYYFPDGGDITVKNTDQTGSWYDINNSMPKAQVTHKVFSTIIGHGNNPASASYQYAVVSSETLKDLEKWIVSDPFRVISNTKDLQAIYNKRSGVYGISFYKEGNVELEKGLSITVDKPCVLLIGKIDMGKGLKISVADPTQMISGITIKVSQKLKGKGAIQDNDKSTSINVELPAGDEAGKTITEVYLRN
jgi:chondroitin AC lyase